VNGNLRVILIILGAFGAAALTAWLIFGLAGMEFSFDGGGGRLIFLIALLTLVASGLLVGRRVGLSTAIKAILFWVGLGLVLLLLYSYRAEFTHMWERVVGELDPSQGISEDAGSMRFNAAADGHFYVRGQADGHGIDFLVDTGASTTVLSREDAEAAGIRVAELRFDRAVETANGRVRAALAVVESLEVAGKRFVREPVFVLDNASRISVLGLSTLRKFRSYEITGDTLILRR
jgi:aspartyl protease family protein